MLQNETSEVNHLRYSTVTFEARESNIQMHLNGSTKVKGLLVLLLLQFLNGMTPTKISESAKYEFTQLKCEIFDKSFGDFSFCKIVYIQRQVDAMSAIYNVAKNISGGVTLTYQLLKKEAGWRPFLYRGEVDVCDFLNYRKKYHIVANLFYSLTENYTNIHKCPYSSGEKIIVNSFQLDAIWILKRFPISIGEYAVSTTWFVNKKLVAKIFGSVAYTDYKSG